MKKTVTIISDEECVGVEGQVHLSPRVRVHYGLHNVHILCSHVPGTGAAARKGDSGSALNLKENGRFVCRQICSVLDRVNNSFKCRYAVVAVNAYSQIYYYDYSYWAKISPDIKEWIQTIASNTQDSNCDQ